MRQSRVEYLRNQISNHLSLFFNPEIVRLFDSGKVKFLSYEEAVKTKERAVAVPCDVPLPNNWEKPVRVSYNNTELTVFNWLPRPSEDSWTPVPDTSAPLWYRNSHGTIITSWNIFGNLFDLLTFGEELRNTRRDKHGRFVAGFSPRVANGLLEVPAFNEAAAVLVSAMLSLDTDEPVLNIDDHLQPVRIVPSHDCDIMYGNDILTQAVRAIRIALPLRRLKPPRVDNIWRIIRNAITPRRYYLANATGMIDLERCFGFTSSYYMLNGTGGRYGARSKPESISEFIPYVPDDWDVGMHYNYDTFLDDNLFGAQRDQLQQLIGADFVSGRAHYLNFDPHRSFPFLRKHGILVDESSGYPDRIGYRNGLAGCFQAYDLEAEKPIDIFEVPMAIMDAVLVRQYGNDAMKKFSALLYHLSRVGGALSVVFHPGMFFNPENKFLLDIYHKMLIECRQIGAVSETARSLMERLRH